MDGSRGVSGVRLRLDRQLAILALVGSLGAVACASAPEPEPVPRLPAGLELEMHAAVLQEVLTPRVLSGPRIAAICLGIGESAEPPSAELLMRFIAGDPPLVPSTSCTRETDPDTSLPVVRTLDGEPGLFLVLTESYTALRGRTVHARIERTDERPVTYRCRVDTNRNRPLDPNGPPVTTWEVRSC
jgi:hypothetical protein